jgi:hypothetical protein
MAPLLLLAMLDLATATPGMGDQKDGLKIVATVDNGVLGARLINVGPKPLNVMVGFSCSGIEQFSYSVDGGEPQQFDAPARDCLRNVPVPMLLAAGREYAIPTHHSRIFQGATRVVVRYENRDESRIHAPVWRGRIQSAPLMLGPANLDVKLHVTVEKPGPVYRLGLEAFHDYHGSTKMRFLTGDNGVCQTVQDVLVVDGAVQPFVPSIPCNGPWAPRLELLSPGGRFVIRGSIELPPGHHRLTARYAVEALQVGFIPGKGDFSDWIGSVDSPTAEIDLP